MVRIQPTNTNTPLADDDISVESSSPINGTGEKSFTVSFRFCIIATTSSLVAFSIIVLTGIWLASITPTSLEMSSTIRENEFLKIRQFSLQLIKDVMTVSNTVTNQLAVHFNSSSDEEKALSMYRLYKSEIASSHKELVATLFIADPQATLVGIYIFGGKPVKFKATQHVSLDLYYCNDVEKYDYCKSSAKPDHVFAPFDNSKTAAACSANPNGTFFLPSFADVTLPDYMFLTLVYCFQQDSYNSSPNDFQYLYAYQLSSNTLSDYLISSTISIVSSVALIVEVDTGFVIATNKKNSGLSVLDEHKNIMRKGLLDLTDADHFEVSSYVYNQFKGEYKNSITCNSNMYFATSTRYIFVYRMCMGIDWLLIYSVPIWNYTRTLIIAVVCAISGGLLILVFSAILGVVLSVRIVAPFKNLITLFNSVSQMNLDSITLSNSRFNEVQQLQMHFMSMVKQIKLYRSFLPPHLLAQIDNDGDDLNEHPENKYRHESDRHETASKSTKSISNSQRSSQNNNMSMLKNKSHINRFELYLEHKSSTVLALYVNGLSQCFAQHLKTEKEILHALRDIFEITNLVSNQFNSQRGYLENDTIILTFNTSTNVNNHEMRAVESAVILQNKLNKLIEKWNSNSDTELFANLFDFRIAICNDDTYCGNVGTPDYKNFTSISCVKTRLVNLFEKSLDMNIKIIMSETIHKRVCSKFESRCLGKVGWLNGNSEFSLFPSITDAATPNSIQSIHVFELGHSLEVKMDEWLYELEQKEKQSRWNRYNSAFEFFEKGDYTTAKILFNEFLVKNPLDIPAIQMLRDCESMTKNN